MRHPTTKAAAYCKRYGRTSANPEGVPFVKGQCAYEIKPRYDTETRQCHRKASVGPDNLYCKRHAKMMQHPLQTLKIRYMEPYSKGWNKQANALARSFCPPIYPCRTCGGPVLQRYCCTRCGDADPSGPQK